MIARAALAIAGLAVLVEEMLLDKLEAESASPS